MPSSTHIESTEVSSGTSTHGHVSLDVIQDAIIPASALVLLSQSGEASAKMSIIGPFLISSIVTDTQEQL